MSKRGSNVYTIVKWSSVSLQWSVEVVYVDHLAPELWGEMSIPHQDIHLYKPPTDANPCLSWIVLLVMATRCLLHPSHHIM